MDLGYRKSILGVALCLMVPTAFPLWAEGSENCVQNNLAQLVDAQTYLQRVAAQMQMDVEIKITQASTGAQTATLLGKANHQAYGYLTFRWSELKPNYLRIGSIKVSETHQGLGISGALLEAVLKKYPSIVEIDSAQIEGTNATIARAGGGIKATPAYKIRARFGFTDICPAPIWVGCESENLVPNGYP